MVDAILSNCTCPHNPIHAVTIRPYLEAYDDLFEHLQKINALTAVAQALEVDRCDLVSEQLFWYFTILNDHAMAADKARAQIAALKEDLFHLCCHARKTSALGEITCERFDAKENSE